jgi:hypothetical protein
MKKNTKNYISQYSKVTIQEEAMNKKWEYKVIGVNSVFEAKDDIKIENKLNALGEDGWELVGILDQVNSGWGTQPRVESNFILLKREKQ